MSFFDDVHVISKYNYPIPMSEVEEVEAELGIRLPNGYRDFITRFGAGVYCDLFRIYTPKEILEKRNLWKEIPYFWHNSATFLNTVQLKDFLIIGDTIDGYEIAFFTQKPKNIYILPRLTDEIDELNADFSDLHLWDVEPSLILKFETWEKRAKIFERSHDFRIDNHSCLEIFKNRWGKILLSNEESGEWGWYFNFCVPAIGGEITIEESEGIISDDYDEPRILDGNYGKQSLAIQINCDEDSAEEVRTFFASLQEQKLITYL